MAESNSPKGSAGVFAKKIQRQLSRGKEKVLQRLGKTVESRDEEFDICLQRFIDQQTDGNRIYKDLKSYHSAVRDMREASRRLSQSLFDAYETDWAGEEDLGAIVEGEDLLWNDYEVKLLDQAVRTMESYMGQFPDIRERVSKRGRKLVDYDSSCHHLEALQTAKKRDDIKITKAEEEVSAAKSIYEGINSELKEELPALYESRIGCYVSVFSTISSLRDIFLKEMCTLNQDLQNVVKELQAQHPDKMFVVKGLQRYGSLKRRSLMSPKSWKASFSDFHTNYSPKPHQRFSFRSPDKPRHGTLSRESSTLAVSPQSPPLDRPSSELRDLDADSTHSDTHRSAEDKPDADSEDTATGTAAEGELEKSGEDRNRGEEEKAVREGETEPEPEPSSDQPSVTTDNKAEGENTPGSESSSELNNSCDSESLELQLSAAGNSPLHIEERADSPVAPGALKPNGLENGGVSGFDSDTKELGFPHKDVPAGNQAPLDSKSTVV
uniref:bridging integrator 2a n=1 Tax=Centroberyx gerrardi TaxID=166262 RepID=UPI003AAEF808